MVPNSIKVELELLARGSNRNGSIVLDVRVNIGQGNVDCGSRDVSAMAAVHLRHLAPGVVLESGVAS